MYIFAKSPVDGSYGFYFKNEETKIIGVEVTDEDHDRIIDEANSTGSTIEPDENGYPVIKPFVLSEEDIKQGKILNLKQKLLDTDYIVIKIGEAETEEERTLLREEYAELIQNRKGWRAEINELTGEK